MKVGVPFTPLRMPPISRGVLYFGTGPSQGIPHCYFGKPELFGDQEDRRYAQPALVRKEGVMHLPEQPGRAGELGAFGVADALRSGGNDGRRAASARQNAAAPG
jgi:hypothetical protein